MSTATLTSLRDYLFGTLSTSDMIWLVEEMKKGMTLRDAQEVLIAQGIKKNAVKQAALVLKKLFE